MTKIELEIHDDIFAAIFKINGVNDPGIELEIPEGSVLFDNILNLKLLKKEAEKSGKTLHIRTDDEVGQNLILMLEEEEAGPKVVSDFSDNEARETNAVSTAKSNRNKQTKRFGLPNFSKPNFPAIKFNSGIFIAAGILCALVIALYFVSKLPKAYVKIVVNSQPLTKSLSIKVKSGFSTSSSDKVIRGIAISANITNSITENTTGEKLIGKKARGSAKIFNKTDAEKVFKKGAILTYTNGKTKLNYLLTSEATISARVQQPEDPENPGVITYKSGEVDATVEAEEIGDKYNIKTGADLSISGQKTTDFSAKVTKDVTGGQSQTVKAVAVEDKTKASADLLKTNTDSVLQALKAKLGTNQNLVEGSQTTSTTTENYDHQVGDQTDSLQLTQTVTTTGLTYFSDDVNKLLDQLSANFVPEGYVVSSKDRELKIDILGNSDSTILSSSEADLQITLKTYVVTDIDSEKVKERLAGKSTRDAQKILSAIKNIKTYQIKIFPSIPFFQRVPKDVGKIEVDIERQ